MKMDPILRSQPIVAKDGIAVYTAVGNISLPHRHQWLELAYLKQGTLLHTIGDVSYKLQAGNFSLWNTIKSIPMLRWARAKSGSATSCSILPSSIPCSTTPATSRTRTTITSFLSTKRASTKSLP